MNVTPIIRELERDIKQRQNAIELLRVISSRPGEVKPKRHMSVAGRKAIARAQRARWKRVEAEAVKTGKVKRMKRKAA